MTSSDKSYRRSMMCKLSACLLFLLLVMPEATYAQEDDSAANNILSSNPADTIKADTTKIIEDAPLDIAQDRGLFIVTPDQKLQLRILGSVRYLIVYDGINLASKNSFNTAEIPTGSDNRSLPNYFNGLDQTRLGFEITRKTSKGNIFIRLETDFAGPDGFRIRHAYGQFRRFLFGQTWSLFSHLNALPSIVDFAGPTSDVVVRTPQLRYYQPQLFGDINFAFGLEYSIPDIQLPYSLKVQALQLIPDITVRLDKDYSWGNWQVSGIFPALSGRDSNQEFVLKFGWGVSASIVANSWRNGTWYFQGVVGTAISRYFGELSGSGWDLTITPQGDILSPVDYGFYASYEHQLHEKWLTSLTYGWLETETYSFVRPERFRRGHTLRANTFWTVVEGARIGGEIIWGTRVDNDEQKGDTYRVNVLFYYDF